MKKLIVFALLIALVVVAAPVAAAEDGNRSATMACKAHQEYAPEIFYLFYQSLGDCVSDLVESQEDVAERCKLDYVLDYYGFKNVGECVAEMRT